MFAVIESGGKQYRVAPGDVIDVELLSGAGEAGSSVRFDRVLMVSGDNGFEVGAPLVEGALVTASLTAASAVRSGNECSTDSSSSVRPCSLLTRYAVAV